MREHNRRRWLPLVDPGLQFRFLVVILGYGALLVLVLGGAIFVPDCLVLADNTADPRAKIRAAEFMLTVHKRLWMPVLVVLVLIGLHFFKSFHRVVGPLYRLRWAWDRIGAGDLSMTVRLRADDLLPREEKAVNEMIAALADKVRAVQESAAQVSASLAALEGTETPPSASRTSAAARENLLMEHRRAVASLTEIVSVFTVR